MTDNKECNCIICLLNNFVIGSGTCLGTLGLNDLDIAEAIRDDLEYVIELFK